MRSFHRAVFTGRDGAWSLAAALILAVAAATASAADVAARRPQATEFPIAREFQRFDIGRWRKDHPHDGGNGWFPGNFEKQPDGSLVITDDTRNWGHWLGPLGVRVRSHLANWQHHPAFAAIAPDILRSEEGKLAMQAMEVVHVVAGGPADGHLQPGDLIVSIMGQPVLDAAEYRPDQEFVHKERRDIQVQAGELIDAAEKTGAFHCTVLRMPDDRKTLWKSGPLADRKTEQAGVAVEPGGRVILSIGDSGDGTDYDQAAWLDGAFSGPGGTVSLDTLTPVEMRSGWGVVAKNVDFADKPLPSPGWRCHGNGFITFVVPEGVDRLTVTAASLNRGRIVAEIAMQPPTPRIPVKTSVVWTGAVGNEKSGPQDFDVALTGDGRLHLRVGDGGDKIHGDGAIWTNVVLTGTYGTKKLSSIRPAALRNGYGSVQTLADEPLEHKGVKLRDGWRCHAISDFVWPLPPGTTRIKGRFTPLSYGQVAPEIGLEPLLTSPPASLQPLVQDVRFAIPRIGSFAEGYPFHCEKSDLLLRQTCDWLAAQQREDGSWPCWAGYTTDAFHTAFCGLALMASGDRKYDDAVRRAADSVIWKTGPSGWTCPRAMVLIFLAELYLRDEDPKLLVPIQNAARQLVECVKTDFMSGHGVNGFGYGYAGQYIGTGFMQLGLALASRCPIEMDREYLDDALAHIAEISCNGGYPYGRGWKATRDGNYRQTGGNAMHGPAALAARITGCTFSEQMTSDAVKRWNTVLGDGDNSHATSTLAFIWSSLAMNACDPETFKRHMEVFRYKMANDHSFDGGWLKSSFILDFQGGEGVTGLWIRSAGMAMILAAPKRALAITGNPKLLAGDLKAGTPCREYDVYVRDFYARNLSLARQVLGSKAPSGLLELRDDLRKLPRDARLNNAQARLLAGRIPRLLEQIAAIKGLDDTARAHAIELTSGVDFQITIDEGRYKVVARMPLQQLAWADTDAEIAKAAAAKQLPFAAELAFEAPALSGLACSFDSRKDGWNRREGEARVEHAFKPADVPDTAPLSIRFQIGNVMAAYRRMIRFKEPDAKGRVSDVTNFRRLEVRAAMAANPVYQTQPLVLDGVAYEAMMLNEAQNFATVDGRTPEGRQPIAIHEGDEVDFELVSAQPLCLEVISMDVRKRPARIAPAKIAAATPGFKLVGDPLVLGDLAFDRDVTLEGPADAERAVVEMIFAKPTKLNGIDLHWNGGQRLVTIWASIDGKWRPLAWDGYDSGAGFHPTFAAVTTAKVRLQFACRGHRVAFQEISPYYNEHQRRLFEPVWDSGMPVGMPPPR